jgi:spermidine/putrescine transport system permease protein
VTAGSSGAVGAAAGDTVSGRPARIGSGRRLDRIGTFWALYLPPLLWLGLFLVLPLLLIAALSFRPDLRGELLGPFQPTTKHYETVARSAGYWRLLGTSAVMAAIVGLAATVLAYPLAYFLALRAGRRAIFFLVLLLIPFWTSYLLRVMAWKLMLGQEGVINSFLMYVGVLSEPLDALIYNRGAVVVTLIYVWVPFAALPILAALQRVDPALLEAAGDLYARPAAQFLRVTLPLSAPGVVAAFFLVFIPTVGEYVTPLLVGGSGGSMYGNIIQDFFIRAANWPLGAALSMTMLTGTLILVVIAARFIDLRRVLQG